MKILNKLSVVALAGLMTVVSCDIDRSGVTTLNADDITAAVITTYPTETLVLDKLISDTQTATFSWDAASYGYSAAITYTIEAYDDNNSAVLGQTTDRSLEVIGTNLNTIAVNTFGVTEGDEVTLNVRVLSSIGQSEYDAVSSSVSFTYTTFGADAVPMYTVGSHQGWDASNGIAIYSEKGDGLYKGWVWFTNVYDESSPASEFVFLSVAGDWSSKIGSIGGDTNTIDYLLVSGDASNIAVGNTASSLYYVSLNTNDVTGEYLYTDITTIGLIGSSIPPYDWGSDVDLVYDASERKFIATGVAMVAGEWKIRVNDDSALSWGAGPADGQLWSEFGGDEIAFAGPDGNYTVKVDLFQLIPTYEIIAE